MRSALLITALFIGAISILVASPAARANDVELAVSAKVYVGQKPTLTLKLKKAVKEAVLEIKGTNGQVIKGKKGPGDAGSSLTFDLPQNGTGVVKWAGRLEVYFDDDSAGSM